MEGAAGQEESGGERGRAAGQGDGEGLVGGVEDEARGEDEDGARQEGGVGTVAGEVLADRDLEPAEAREGNADEDPSGFAADHADRERDDPGEDDELGQWSRSPGSRRSLVGC